jgi:hypothetical protein
MASCRGLRRDIKHFDTIPTQKPSFMALMSLLGDEENMNPDTTASASGRRPSQEVDVVECRKE